MKSGIKISAISRRNFIKLGGAAVAFSSVGYASVPQRDTDSEEDKIQKIKSFRRLGRTEFKVSDISMGTTRFKEGNVIRYAYDRGVNYFDTAEGYGNGESERLIGQNMKFMQRDKIFITTKLHVEQDETGRQKKIYKITSKGEETLKMILQKHQIMTESIKSIIISTLGITDETEPAFLEDLDKLISFPGMDIIKEITLESKIEVLKDHKKLIAHRIEVMSYNHKKIDKILSQLEKGGNNRDVDLPSKNIASH